MLIRARNYDAALESVVGYGELLRAVLDGGTHDVPLHDELAFVDRYLSIERMRFSDRLATRIDADAAVGDALIPRLILQPLVENALRHGLGESDGEARLEILARRRASSLRIEIRDNGVGFASRRRSPEGNGVGLRNTRQRLDQRYGDDYRFELESSEEGTAAVLEIPYQTASSSALYV
jgi:LytS/YehU family sensor histidine kinase